MSPSDLRRHAVRGLAALTHTAPLHRPGSPGSSAPLLGAPPPGDARPLARARSQTRRSLRLSMVEGMFAEVFTACAGATALTAWALALKLGPFLVGVMTALPFFAQFIQFPAAWLTSLLGHRRVALGAVCLSRLVMFPLCLVPWLPLTLVGQQRLLVGIAGVSAVLGVVGNNAWVAWMGELVPRSVRGRYFGRRSALCTLGGTLASLAAGLLMDRLRPPEGVGLALPLLALLSCGIGVLTTLLMAAKHDPSPDLQAPKLDMQATLLPLRDTRARQVLLFQVAWNAAVGLSAPFYTLHMLQNLKMTFVVMALETASVAAVRILTAPFWGRAIDRFGAQPVLLGCSVGMALVPLIWLLPTAGTLWPLGFDVLLSGTFWSGHGLASFALPLAVAPREGRPFYLAAFSTAGGLAYAAASTAGGGLASLMPTHFILGGHPWVNLHVLFMLSSVARFLAALLAARIVEPGARTVGSLGELVARVLSRARPAPALVPVSEESAQTR